MKQGLKATCLNVLSPTQQGEAKIALTAGVLTDNDVNAEYASDASVDFKPFVVNPEKTMDETDRFLRKRIKNIIGPTFYIATVGSVPLKEPMDITVGFNVSIFHSDDIEGEPHLLFWQTDTQQWKDASHTCKDTFGEYKYDWNDGILSVKYKSEFKICIHLSGNSKISYAIVGPFVNSPPRITSASKLWMLEDGGTLRYRLTYTDDDGDNVTFSVEPNSPETGEEVKVSKEGDFRYTPCLDCYGIHDITVSAVEERYDDFEALSTTKKNHFIDAECSDLANITEDHLTIKTPETAVVVHPCGLVTPHHRDRLAWVFTAVRYVPQVEYIGEDSFKINAVDQEGAHSEVAVVSVYVLANPCLNGGSCRGPQSDPDCLSKERSNGFDGYSCICQHGFIGEFCETKSNKCQPNPCPYNFTCVDMFDAHSCHCENKDWPCGEITSASYTAIIVSICGGAVLVILGTVIAWRRLNRQKEKMNIVAPSPCDITYEPKQPHFDETSDTTEDVDPLPIILFLNSLLLSQ
ncbi:uncharacterized protein [Ptychodera flava]|uniref:uncharacterized protein n=1 Tax=Ptychodera flava TaxID=63121 RepID=UPI00396A8545